RTGRSSHARRDRPAPCRPAPASSARRSARRYRPCAARSGACRGPRRPSSLLRRAPRACRRRKPTAAPEPRRRRARRSGARVRASSAYFHPFPQDTRMGQALPYPVVLPKLRDPRLHLAATITSLQVIGQVGFHFQLSIAQILLSVGTCAALEVAIALRTQRVILWPASALLTGNGVAFVLRVP